MIKYYCNKCGIEVKKSLLKIVTSDSNEVKKSYHLCAVCTKAFVKFMELSPVEEAAGQFDGAKNSKDSEDDKILMEAMGQVPELGSQVGNYIEQPAGDSGNNKTKNDNKRFAPKTPREGKYLTAEVKKYIDEHEGSQKPAEIANDLDIPYYSVYQYINSKKKKSFGEVDAEPTSEMGKGDVGTCIALRRADWSISEIAKELGRDEDDILVALRRNGMS